MADTTPQKRTLPARERRESAAKRRASSPAQIPSTASSPVARKTSATASTTTPTATPTPAPGRKTGYIRGPYKKRSSLAQTQTSTPGSRSSPSVSIAGDAVPARLLGKQPLPTTTEKPAAKLSLKEYQSISESAILAASLFQSRMQWLYNGVFEKYYVKKRKGVEVPANNPDVKSMQRLGPATMTIEPHTFDVFFYVVKDFTIPVAYQRPPSQPTVPPMGPPSHPHPHPHPAYNTQSPHQQPRPPASNPPVLSAPAVNSTPSVQPPTIAQPHSMPELPPPAAGAAQHGLPPDPGKREVAATATPTTPAPPQTPSAPPSRETPTQTPQAVPKPNPPASKGSTQDPVIQMLAARAATDPQLKDLMKIVATSRATPEQLKEFQSHIDEFNEVIRRQEARRAANSDEGRAKQPGPSETQTGASPSPAPINSKTATTQPPGVPPTSTRPQAAVPPRPTPYHAPQPQPRQHPATGVSSALPGVVHGYPLPNSGAGRGGPIGGHVGYPHQPSPRPEPFIKHIVMEITSVPSGNHGACPDRWLFPKFAVLEMRPNGLDMICSFLVERTGSQLRPAGSVEPGSNSSDAGDKWKADQEYYQPVTMTIRGRDHKLIETIAKAAKTLPKVQEYMKEVMSKKERAPVEYLVHQLPHEKSHAGADSTDPEFVDSGVEVVSDSPSADDELKDFYGI